ncbi:MAG: hypothetical protein JXR73_16365 [Candidatus Omnitrophica bacterium]|nr:hypothetical protein [Candidatus Omnitrophota bacterium]
MQVIPIRRAILSVFDKTGIDEFGRALAEKEVHLLSTGGTGRALLKAGVKFQEVSDYTGSPEMLGGRVKTLHPKIHGGLLFKRGDDAQTAEAEKYGIYAIDLVAVNLYPFEATVAKPDVSMNAATENIDIGGPTMIRSAAKNFQSVTVVTDPRDYEKIIDELNSQGGISLETRHRLAAKAFDHTSRYDSAITAFLTSRLES